MDLGSLYSPPGFGHLANLVPPPGLEVPANFTAPPGLELPVDLTPPPGLELPGDLTPPPGLELAGDFALPPSLQPVVEVKSEGEYLQQQAKLQRPPGHFKSDPQRPPGIFSVQEKPYPLYLPPLEGLLYDLQPPCSWQPAFPTSFNLPPFAQHCQPIRPPGNWGNVSVASTAIPSPILSSPRWDDTVSSDEDELLHKTTVVHNEMPAPSLVKGVREASDAHDVCQSVSSLRMHAESKAQEAPIDRGSGLIEWQVDAKKLSSMHRQIISPTFKISQQVSVKIMIKPKAVGQRKGQAGFLTSNGVGSMEVKLVEGSSLAPKLRFCISVGDQPKRGPVEHDFGMSSVCSLPKDMQEWNFLSSVSPESSNFLVSLHVLDVMPSRALTEQVFV